MIVTLGACNWGRVGLVDKWGAWILARSDFSKSLFVNRPFPFDNPTCSLPILMFVDPPLSV